MNRLKKKFDREIARKGLGTFGQLLVFFVFYLLYRKFATKIVWVEDHIPLYWLGAISVITAFLLMRKRFKEMYYFERILVWALISYVCFVVVMTPLNIYNSLFFSERNELQKERCRITGVHKRRMSRGMNIDFAGKSVFIKGYKEEFKVIEKKLKEEEFYVSVSYKDGLLGTRVIKKVDFVKVLSKAAEGN